MYEWVSAIGPYAILLVVAVVILGFGRRRHSQTALAVLASQGLSTEIPPDDWKYPSAMEMEEEQQ